MTFREKVQNTHISPHPPNKPGFKYENWIKEFKSLDEPTYDDNMLFYAGIVFLKYLKS